MRYVSRKLTLRRFVGVILFSILAVLTASESARAVYYNLGAFFRTQLSGIPAPTFKLDFTQNTIVPQVGTQAFTFSRADAAPAATYYDQTGLLRVAAHNIARYSEVFNTASSGSVWTNLNSSVTSNSTTAPDATSTADTFTETAATGRHEVSQSITKLAASEPYVGSVYVKAGTRSRVALTLGDSTLTNYSRVVFNLSTGAVENYYSAGEGFIFTNANITSVGSGWYRLYINTTTDAVATSVVFAVTHMSDAFTISYAGNTGNNIYLWGAQVERNNSPSTYIPTTTAAIYNTPRYDFDPISHAPRGIRIEENSTNLLTYSETLDHGNWWKTNASVFANTTVTLDPMGGYSAEALIEDTTSASMHYMGQTITTAGGAKKYSASIYVKAGTRTEIALALSGGGGGVLTLVNLTTGAVTAPTPWGSWVADLSKIEKLQNGWYRASVSGTSDTGTSLDMQIELYNGGDTYNGDGSGHVFLYGAQIEYQNLSGGTTVSSGTNYIPTTTE